MGANAKVRDLDQRYPELLRAEHAPEYPIHLSLTDTTHATSGVLDVSTIIKASQAISSEIVLERLLARLLELVLESAGAELLDHL